MPGDHDQIRARARRFEESLPMEKRKRLGQFFTGVPLGKLLAHLALAPDIRTVIDPMAGHGDLLDATIEAASERLQTLERLDGVEIDPDTACFCAERLDAIARGRQTILRGSAFQQATLNQLPERSYDLAITNPPYVRYQSQNGAPSQGTAVRNGLADIIAARPSDIERPIWLTLTQGYSGLADLSVPAWILSGLMIRAHGRLALVVPATWRSREYADIVRYLLLRSFRLEYIVEDTQPGWFSDALVRTHLIVARRLAPQESARPLSTRTEWSMARWLQISPDAADSHSLVGAAFNERYPDAAFARWLEAGALDARRGIQVRNFDLHEEWSTLRARISRRSWYKELEADVGNLPLFSESKAASAPLPPALRAVLGDGPHHAPLEILESAGIRVGQGLRTGCNRFFYVEATGRDGKDSVIVRLSAAFGGREISVPSDVLRPVLRRQSELSVIEGGRLPPGQVLDLRQWVLPDDAQIVAQAQTTYSKLGESVPQVMPAALAAFVRLAADAAINDEDNERVPELSAVRTNVRAHRAGSATPRFWYMLPDFMPRHEPAAFVARINHGAAWVECNLDPPILVDANFSTFWSPDQRWTRFGIKALLNSAWCQLFMESVGTPMGGGALKLEAVHLRQLLVPRLSLDQQAQLHEAGQALTRGRTDILHRIDDLVLRAVLGTTAAEANRVRDAVAERTENLRRMRLRTAA